MTLKERLQACRSAQTRINTLCERRLLYASLSAPISITPFYSEREDRANYYLIKMQELTEQIRKLIVEEEVERQACAKLLATLSEPEYTVMWLHYCEHLSWRQVAKRTYYTIDNCMKLQQKALRALAQQSLQ